MRTITKMASCLLLTAPLVSLATPAQADDRAWNSDGRDRDPRYSSDSRNYR